MNEYTFPFSTCETPDENGIISQPYSVFFNSISCLVILYFLTKTKNASSFALLFVLLLFESFHTFSHSIHLAGNIQTFIVHCLAYLVNITYLAALYNFTDIFPSPFFIGYLLSLSLFDIYAFRNLPAIYYISSQLFIFFSLFSYYYHYFPQSIRKKIPLIFFWIVVALLLVLNESFNCEKMLRLFNLFPVHILVEIVGMILFYYVSSIFYTL